jgi:putative RNase toxin 5 of polymorphic toxin system
LEIGSMPMSFLPLVATELAKRITAAAVRAKKVPTPAVPMTPEKMAEIEAKYKAFKWSWCVDLPLDTRRVLTAEEVARIEGRVRVLNQVVKVYFANGNETDGSIISHLIGELKSRVLLNRRMLEMKSAEEWERWNHLSEAERSLEQTLHDHPDWRVGSNILNDMTGSFLEESQSTDVQVFQAAVSGAILARTMEVFGPPSPAPLPPGSIMSRISRIAAFVGTRGQFRTYVLRKLQAEPNNPLRFLLNANGTDFKTASSRAHSELINNPDVWEAGHITSDKLGGTRLMIQSAWENQVQNISVEHTRVGGAVLDNPVIEVGGFPVAKTTVKWWEQAGRLPAGTAERAPVIQ